VPRDRFPFSARRESILGRSLLPWFLKPCFGLVPVADPMRHSSRLVVHPWPFMCPIWSGAKDFGRSTIPPSGLVRLPLSMSCAFPIPTSAVARPLFRRLFGRDYIGPFSFPCRPEPLPSLLRSRNKDIPYLVFIVFLCFRDGVWLSFRFLDLFLLRYIKILGIVLAFFLRFFFVDFPASPACPGCWNLGIAPRSF